MRKLSAILFLFCILSYFGYAQNGSNNSSNSGNDINSTIGGLSSEAAKSYVDPIIGSFGSNLNTGWITKAPAPTKFSFSLDLKVMAMGSFISDVPKTFSTTGSFNFTQTQAEDIAAQLSPNNTTQQTLIRNELLSHAWTAHFSGPTIAGSKDEHVVLDFPGQTVNGESIPNDTLDNVKGYLNNLSIFPTPGIQLGIGTFMGTNVAIRWFPKVNIKDLGDFTYWGFGIMHNPAVWFENQQFPVDIALGYFYQDLKVGSIFETKAHMFGIYASKTYGTIIGFTPYVGLSTESSTTTINYDYKYSIIVNGNPVQQTSNINFELDGTNSTAFTVGMAFKLAILNLNVDYKFAKVKTASAGLTFGF